MRQLKPSYTQKHFSNYTSREFSPKSHPQNTINMSGQSNVGSAGVYEANEQRTVSDQQLEEQKKENRFHEGKKNSHKALDSSMFIPSPDCHFAHMYLNIA